MSPLWKIIKASSKISTNLDNLYTFWKPLTHRFQKCKIWSKCLTSCHTMWRDVMSTFKDKCFWWKMATLSFPKDWSYKHLRIDVCRPTHITQGVICRCMYSNLTSWSHSFNMHTSTDYSTDCVTDLMPVAERINASIEAGECLVWVISNPIIVITWI